MAKKKAIIEVEYTKNIGKYMTNVICRYLELKSDYMSIFQNLIICFTRILDCESEFFFNSDRK